MNKPMLTAIALIALTSTANASLENVTLVGASNGGPGGVQAAILSGSSTWTWDTVTGDIVGTGPLTMTYNFGPNNVFVQDVLDLSITGAGIATATPFVNAPTGFHCTNGFFASAGLHRDVCAGYAYGANTVNNSVVSPDGLVVTLGGDDVSAGAPQSLVANWGVTGRNLVTGNLQVQSATYNPATAGMFTLTFVPVPGAVWLFGSALGLLGVARRKFA